MQFFSPTSRVSSARYDTWPVLPSWAAKGTAPSREGLLDSAARDTRLLASQGPQNPNTHPRKYASHEYKQKMAVHSGVLRALLPVYGAER